MPSSSLPREILKWVQSLDLSYTIKNPKRDFSNGFLIAEILSRYYPQDVQMHSYDNGISSKSKKNNWEQLEKIYRKKRIPISKQMMDNVMSNKPDAATIILSILYTHATDRVLPPSKSISTTPDVPSYAKPKHEKVRVDFGQIREDSLKRGSIKGRNLNLPQSPDNKTPLLTTPAKISKCVSVLEEMVPIFEKYLKDFDYSGLVIQQGDIVHSFVSHLQELEDLCIQNISNEIRKKIPDFVERMLETPKEFQIFFNFLSPCLELPNDVLGLNEAVNLFSLLGENLLHKDQNSTWKLFEDYGFEKIALLLKKSPPKRKTLLHIIYSFCANEIDIHREVIKSLQEKLDNMTFIYSLSSLITLETDFNEEMLDLYVYYCMMGVGSSSPSLRASSISMLPVIANQNAEIVYKLLDSVIVLLDDDWWEIKAQLIVLACGLLEFCNAKNKKEEFEKAMWIIKTILSRPNIPYIHTIALSCLAPQLKYHQELCGLYTHLLLSLGDDERQFCLDENEYESVFQIGCSCPYKLYSLPHRWYGLGIAYCLDNIIQSKKMKYLERKYLEIIYACVFTAMLRGDEDMSIWTRIFSDISPMIYTSLTVESVCEIAADVLVGFFKFLPAEVTIKSMSHLIKELEIIYAVRGPVSRKCQESIPQFLISMYDAGGQIVIALEKLASEMISQNMQRTPLGEFIDFMQHRQYSESN